MANYEITRELILLRAEADEHCRKALGVIQSDKLNQAELLAEINAIRKALAEMQTIHMQYGALPF